MRRSSARYHSLTVALVWGVISVVSRNDHGLRTMALIKAIASYIAAPSGSVRVNQTLQLSTQSKVTGSPMSFWVNGVQGGDATVGTVDANGLYTAPAIVPTPNSVTITSLAKNFPGDTPGSVTVSVLNPIPIINSVTPSSFSEGTSTITISGSQFVYGAQIVWNGVPVPTTFVSNTELAAPIAAPNPGTYPLTVNNPDPDQRIRRLSRR